VTALILGLALAPVFDAFDEPLDPRRWYVGVPQPPRGGRLLVPKKGWIASRGYADDGLRVLELDFRHKGGDLVVSFHAEKEPLSRPRATLVVKRKGRGERTLRVTADGATLDGEPVAFDGGPSGTFRLGAAGGDVELLEVRADPRPPPPRPPGYLEKRTVLHATTPPRHAVGDAVHVRRTLVLWDAEVAFLLRRGDGDTKPLRAPLRGAPTLAALVTAGDAGKLALEASGHPLAMRDWGDERGNLSRAEFLAYLKREYALFTMLQQAQRALNLAVTDRELEELEPLVALAVIRHAANARAAVALAETLGQKEALKALREALGRTEPARATKDQLRAAAGRAAKAVLGGKVPAAWPGFSFDPSNRYLALQQARELVR